MTSLPVSNIANMGIRIFDKWIHEQFLQGCLGKYLSDIRRECRVCMLDDNVEVPLNTSFLKGIDKILG